MHQLLVLVVSGACCTGVHCVCMAAVNAPKMAVLLYSVVCRLRDYCMSPFILSYVCLQVSAATDHGAQIILLKKQVGNYSIGLDMTASCSDNTLLVLRYFEGAAFQDMYDNVNGMRDHFAAFWAKVLTYDVLCFPYFGMILEA